MNKLTADPFNKDCPSRVVLEIISNKWVILIVEVLAKKPLHFGELKKINEGISPKVLAQLLKKLEANGIVKRFCYSEKPLRVEYSLSSLGISLSTVCEEITKWSINHIEQILLARSNKSNQ